MRPRIAHDAGRDGVLVRERIANRHHPLAHSQRVRVAHHDRRQGAVGPYPQQRDVRFGIAAHDRGGQHLPRRQPDGDAFGAVDHVVVRDHMAVGVHEEPCAGAATRASALAIGTAKLLPRLGAARASRGPAFAACARIHRHHGRVHLLGDVGERRGHRRGWRGRSGQARDGFRRRLGGDGRRGCHVARQHQSDQQAHRRGEAGGHQGKAPRKLDHFESQPDQPSFLRPAAGGASRHCTSEAEPACSSMRGGASLVMCPL